MNKYPDEKELMDLCKTVQNLSKIRQARDLIFSIKIEDDIQLFNEIKALQAKVKHVETLQRHSFQHAFKAATNIDGLRDFLID